MADEKKSKVMIIDDDKFLLDMYSLKFSEAGFDVTACEGPEVALTKAKEGFKPDIALVDIIMPGMDGFTLIETIKKENLLNGATIIVLSNLGQKEDIERGLAVGAAGYIVKASATPSEVMNRVKEIVGGKKS